MSTLDPSTLADAAWTLGTGRQALRHRRIAVAATGDEAKAALTTAAPLMSAEARTDRAVAFMFCGAGSQYPAMGAGIYAAEPVFRAVVDDCLSRLAEQGRGELRRWLLASAEDATQARRELERPSLALPALFTVQVALARLWMSWGVQPASMIGHSSGEYAAAHLAGVLDLADALRLVATRGRLFEQLPPGAMTSVPLSEDALTPLLPPDVTIAAINAPELCIASGPITSIERLESALTAAEVETQRVRIALAAHSPMLDPILEPFRRCLAGVRLHAPTLPFVSNLTGDWITAAEATDPEYWVRHLRGTVRFTHGLATLLGKDEVALLEVGPGRTRASILGTSRPNRS